MRLGFHRTIVAARRLFEVSRFGKMADRVMQSRPEGNSVNSWSNVTDRERGQPPQWNTSQVSYEEEFPSFSASISSTPKSKRRTRVDMGTSSEDKSKDVEDIEPQPVQNPPSISHQKDACLPTRFGNKRLSSSRSPLLHQTHHGHGAAKNSSRFSPDTTTNEPFDICSPETKESNSLIGSVKAKNGENLIQKVQSAEEEEHPKDGMEKKNSVEHSVEETGRLLRPGMVLFKQYVPLPEQVDIVSRCRELGCGPGGFYRPGYDDGAKLRLYMMCLGLDWNPQTRSYGERRHHDNVPPPDIPHEFTSLVSRVIDDSHTLIKRDLKTVNADEILPAISPDVCIINFYAASGRLGLHQDRDESTQSLQKGLPVVSISIGDSAEFLYGDERNVGKADTLTLESGDVLIFGGESRHIFHGVKMIIPDTAPPDLLKFTGLRPGRLNLTFRKY